MIKALNVGYRVGSDRWLVNDVSLEVGAGEFVVLLGPNGAGKTTLLRLLSGELRPHNGQIVINNKPLREYATHDLALQRSVMRQNIDMNFDFTVQDVVMMGRHPYIRFAETQQDRDVVAEMMDITESNVLSDRLYATLSGGEKARVTLARVLAQQTPIVMLDEPTSAMDPRHQHLTMTIARQLVADGHAVIAILHDLNLASMYADRIGIMQSGRLIMVDTPANVLTAENIYRAFGIGVHITEHPEIGCPVIIPLHR